MAGSPYAGLAALAALGAALALAAPSLLPPRLPELPTKTAPAPAPRAQEAAILSPRPLPTPERVAALFGWAPGPAGSAKAAPRPEAQEAAWLRPVGEIERADGSRWLFFRDERSGRVFGVRDDGSGLIAETPEAFTIAVDDGTWIVPRRR